MPVAHREAALRALPPRPRHDVAVRAHHALRRPGRARREVDEPGVLVEDLDGRHVRGVAGRILEHDGCETERSRQLGVLALDHGQPRVAGADETLEAVERFAGVYGRADEPGVQHAAEADGRRGAMAAQQRDRGARVGFALEEGVRDLVGPFVQLAVADAALAVVDRDDVGDPLHDEAHRLGDGEVGMGEQRLVADAIVARVELLPYHGCRAFRARDRPRIRLSGSPVTAGPP